MSGPCGFEIPGGAGGTAQGTVGDELAAGPHVPYCDAHGVAVMSAMSSLPDLTYHCSGSHWLAPGVAPAELRASMIPGDEDAVRRVGRRGREIVQDRQVDALEFVDLPVVGGLAVEPGAVDFPGACPACARIVWGFPGGMRRCRGPGRSWLFPLPVPGVMIRVSLSRTHWQEARRSILSRPGLRSGGIFDVLDARVLVFEPRLPDEPGDLARAARLGLRVEHEFDFLLEPHVVVGFVVDDPRGACRPWRGS